MDKRAAAFARLFQRVQVGVYIGTFSSDGTSTVAANPHLKLIFGYDNDADDAEVRPFDRDRFVDPQARVALLERLATDGTVTNYLMRLRRADDRRSSSATCPEVRRKASTIASRCCVVLRPLRSR